MKLSQNFTLEELTFSETAARLGIDNTPDEEEIGNLIILCDELLEPIRTTFGAVHINSGFRCLELNRRLGSKDTSAHVQGLAADFRVHGISPLEVCKVASQMGLPYQQNIYEGRWTHIASAPHGATPKRECLTAVFERGGTRYIKGLVANPNVSPRLP